MRRSALLVLAALVAGLASGGSATAQRRQTTTPSTREKVRRDTTRSGEPAGKEGLRKLGSGKPLYQVVIDLPGRYDGLNESGNNPCVATYDVGEWQSVSFVLSNRGGTSGAPIHIAPLLLRTDVAGATPQLAAVPLEVLPPPPGGSGPGKLNYKVPDQAGIYEMRIFVAEAPNNDQGLIDPGTFGHCRPILKVVKLHVNLEMSEVYVDAQHLKGCADQSQTSFIPKCWTLAPDFAVVTVRNSGTAPSKPFTIKASVTKGCNKDTLLKSDSIPPGGEVRLKNAFPSIPGFQKCVPEGGSRGVASINVAYRILEYPESGVKHYVGEVW